MDINSVIADYIAAKEKAAAEKKRADGLKAIILQHAGKAGSFTTDLYTVIIKTSVSRRIDTEALLKDFPDIKETYGKNTPSTTVDIATAAAAGKASA